MPGPRARLTLGGPPVEAVFPLVPLAPGTAVAVGTLTWNGRLCVGIETDPALVPATVLAAAVEAQFAAVSDRAGADQTASAVQPGGDDRDPMAPA
jgi:hypothetical protein